MLTPLTIINLNAQMFIGDADIRQNAEYARWAQGIDKGVVRMQEVVDRMLDVAKIDSQSLDLHPALLDLPFLIRQVMNRFRGAAAERTTPTVSTSSTCPRCAPCAQRTRP